MKGGVLKMAGFETERSHYGQNIIFGSDFGGSVDNLRVKGSGRKVFRGVSIDADCCDLKGYDIVQGALDLELLLRDHPPAIFTWVVDPGVGTERRGLLVETRDGSVLIGPDNGLLVPAARYAGIDKIWVLNRRKLKAGSFSLFDGRDWFIKAAARLQEGALPRDIANPNPIKPDEIIPLSFKRNQVVRIDGSGNVVLQNAGYNYVPYKTALSIEAPGYRGRVNFVRSFDDVSINELGVLRGTTGRRIWVFANQKSAADILQVEVGQVLGVLPIGARFRRAILEGNHRATFVRGEYTYEL